MPIRVTVLGSGTGVPSLERSSSSILMEIEGAFLLFDIGAGTMHRLLQVGRSMSDISHLFISHYHPDHAGELASFLFALKYFENRGNRGVLTIVGAKGLLRMYSGLRQAFNNWIELGSDALSMVELSNTERDHTSFGKFDIDTLPAAHIESSIFYRVTDIDGTAAVYTGDTDFSDGLIELARDAELLICESSLPDSKKKQGHLTPSLAGQIATEAGVKILVLTHLYPEVLQIDIEAECRKYYDGTLIIAKDLLSFELNKQI